VEAFVGTGVPIDVLMKADVAGPVAAPAGTLTVLESPLPGVVSLTNPLDATLGALEESDAELRLRREAELEASGSTTVDAIRAAVQVVETVTETKVYTNRSGAIDSGGRPPKSFEVVVVHGNADGVAQAVWDHRPAGIEPYSATADSGEAIDAEGLTQVVPFSEATSRRLWARVTGTKDSLYAGDAAVKETLEDFTEGELQLVASNGNVIQGRADIADTVYRSKLSSAVVSVPGVVSVVSVELSVDGVAWSNADYQLGEREYLGVAPAERGIREADITRSWRLSRTSKTRSRSCSPSAAWTRPSAPSSTCLAPSWASLGRVAPMSCIAPGSRRVSW
jgi:hypothetical protein